MLYQTWLRFRWATISTGPPVYSYGTVTEIDKQNDGSETKDYEVLEKIGADDGI